MYGAHMSKPKPHRTRDVPLNLMTTSAERRRWQAKADESKLSLSAWIRAALDHAPAFRVVLTPEQATSRAIGAIRKVAP